MITLVQLLKFAVEQRATDLHIVAGSPPALRVDGRVIRVKTEALNKETTRKLCYTVLNEFQKGKFEEKRELDFSFEVTGLSRFRANYFVQKGSMSGVFRRIPAEIPTPEQLKLPKHITDISKLPYGMVLVTGPTGSGKSTTLASLLDRINTEQQGHIITLEDPIEYQFEHRNCIVNQREIGSDTESFTNALKYLLRQDPDYCLVGELRDRDTVEACLTLAETGHLVFGTLHTNSASQTLSRLISMYPGEQQDRVRNLLSFVLQAVVSQRLLPKIGGGLVAAIEYMALTPNIRNLIRENKMHQVESMMQIGQSETGMITMNQALAQLVAKKMIDIPTATTESNDVEQLAGLLKKAGVV